MPGGRRARRYSLRLPLEAYSTSTYRGPATHSESVTHGTRVPRAAERDGSRRLTVLRARPQQVDDVLVFPDHLHHLHLRHQVRQVFVRGVILGQRKERVDVVTMDIHICIYIYMHIYPCMYLYVVHPLAEPSPLSIFAATSRGLLGFSLSMPMASAITTWPKQPSPRGLPRVSLQAQETASEDAFTEDASTAQSQSDRQVA